MGAGEDQDEGLHVPAKESGSLPDRGKRQQSRSSHVGGQTNKTWQLMGCEGVEKEEWNKE